MKQITKVMAVLNDIENIDVLLKRSVNIATEQNAQLEVLFVQEQSLFAIPDFFSTSDELDKKKIKSEIISTLDGLGFKDNCPIFVYIDDTLDRVNYLTKECQDTLIIMRYHENISKNIVKNIHLPVLYIRDDLVENYKKIIVPFDLSLVSQRCVTLAKEIFSKSNLEIVYDYRYLPSVEIAGFEPMLYSSIYIDTDFNPNQIKIKKEELKQYSIKKDVKEHFIVEKESIEEDLLDFINKNSYDLIVMGSSNIDTLFFKSVTLNMLDKSLVDMLVYHQEK